MVFERIVKLFEATRSRHGVQKITNLSIKTFGTPNDLPKTYRDLRNFNYFKAEEFRQWILFWGIPILGPYMDKDILDLWHVTKQFVETAEQKLTNERIKKKQIETLEHLGAIICIKFKSISEDGKYLTCKMHCLQHFYLFVKWNGVSSNFTAQHHENYLTTIRANIPDNLTYWYFWRCTLLSVNHLLHHLESKLGSNEKENISLSIELDPFKQLPVAQIGPKIEPFLSMKQLVTATHKIVEDYKEFKLGAVNEFSTKVEYFARTCVNSYTIHSKRYTRCTVSVNYNILFNYDDTEQIGEVQGFVKMKNSFRAMIFAAIKCYKPIGKRKDTKDEIVNFEPSESIIFISLSQILKCVILIPSTSNPRPYKVFGKNQFLCKPYQSVIRF